MSADTKNSSTNKNTKLFSVREAATFSSYSPAYLTRLIKQGKIDAKQINRQWHIDASSLENFLKEVTVAKKNLREKIRQERIAERNVAPILSSSDTSVSPDISPLSLQALSHSVAVVVSFLFFFMLGSGLHSYDYLAMLDKFNNEVDGMNLLGNSNSSLPALALFSDNQGLFSEIKENLWCGIQVMFLKDGSCLYFPLYEYAIVGPRKDSESNSTIASNPTTTSNNTSNGSGSTSIVNEYITNNNNPVVEVKEVIIEERLIDLDRLSTKDNLSRQTEEITDAISDLSVSFETDLLTVNGELTSATATIDGTLTTTGAISSNRHVSTSYFVATDDSATSTFSGALTVGTTTSNAALTLDGAAYLASITVPSDTSSLLYNLNGELYWAGNSISGSTAGAWSSDGTNVWRSGGSVGIGTTTPSHKLTVAGDQLTTGYLSVARGIPENTAAGDITATRLFLGNYPALTTNVSPALQVVGNSAATSQILSARYSDDSLPPGFQSAKARGTSSAPGAVQLGDALYSLTGYGYTSSGSFGQGSFILALVDKTPTSTAVPTALTFNVASSTTPIEALRISSNLNVGIGTTTPSARLAITGIAGTDDIFAIASSTNARLITVTSAGSVGIGTAAPTRGRLELVQSIDTINGGFGVVNSGISGSVRFWVNSSGAGIVDNGSASGYLLLNPSNGGNVGIGTTTPSSKLTVQGNAWFGGNITATGTLDITGQTTLANASTTNLSISGNTYFPSGIWNSSGNVGIGTRTTSTRLHVVESSSNTGAAAGLTIENSSTGDPVINFLLTGVQRWTVGVDNSDSDIFKIGRGSDWASGVDLAITTSGNVGIGTTTPAYKLDVAGQGRFGTNGLAGSIAFSRFSDGSAQGLVGYLNGAESSNLSLQSNGGGSLLTFYTASNERMRIDSSGNVGIGTTTPSAKLDIYGTAGSANIFALSSSTNARLFTVTAAGRVGIGTSNPTDTLQVNGGLTIGGDTVEANRSRLYEDFGLHIDSGVSTRPIIFEIDTTERMRVHTNGNIGIGTTSPSTKLEVFATGEALRIGNDTNASNYIGIARIVADGTLRAMFGYNATTNNLAIQGGTGKGIEFNVNNGTFGSGNVVSITTLGNFGIGTTTPSSKLSVVGDGWFGGNLTATGTLAITGNATLTNASSTNLSISGNTYFPSGIWNSSGNVGIGTTSPTSILQLNAPIHFTRMFETDGTVNKRMYGWAAVTDNISFTARDDAGNLTRTLVNFTHDGVTSFTAGNVGIGTTSPSARLTIAPSSRSSYAANIFDTDGSNSGGLYLGSAGDGALILNDASGASMAQIHGGGAGNSSFIMSTFGVGTSTPSAKLAITGTAGTSDIFAIASSTNARLFTVTAAGYVGIGTSTPGAPLHVTGISAGAGDWQLLERTGVRTWALNSASGGFNIVDRGATGISSNTRFTIDTSGNVGIGTTTPASKLDVYDTSRFTVGDGLELRRSGTPYFDFKDSDSKDFDFRLIQQASGVFSVMSSTTGDILNISTGGNVGIGTTSPTSLLHLYATAAPALTLERATAANANLLLKNPSGSLYLGINGNADFGIGTSADLATNPYFFINKTSGNVGIGTTTPSAKLHITGTAGSSDIFALSSSTNSRLFTVTAAGNVGVGTSAPGSKLSVSITAGQAIPVLGANSSTFSLLEEGLYGLIGGPLGSGNSYLQAQRVDGTATAYDLLLQPNGGKVGIGTTSPAAFLHIYNSNPSAMFQDTVSGASVSSVLEFYGVDGVRTGYVGDGSSGDSNMYINSGAGDISLTGTGGTCTLTGAASGGTCFSDSRLKTINSEITGTLDGISTLSLKTFYWNDLANEVTNASTTILNTGFLAQNISDVFPELVYTNEEGYKTLDYSTLSMYGIQAIKELNLKLEDLATTTLFADLDTDSFTKRFFDTLIAWMADSANGIGNMYANVFNAGEKICVDGECLTADDIRALRSTIGSGNNDGDGQGGSGTTPTDVCPDIEGTQTDSAECPAGDGDSPTTDPLGTDTTAPTIVLNGDSSIILTVGDSYNEEGATANDNIDGDITSSIQTSGTVDTTTAGTYTISYEVSDQAGNSAEVTRTVTVEEEPANQAPEPEQTPEPEPAPEPEPEPTPVP